MTDPAAPSIGYYQVPSPNEFRALCRKGQTLAGLDNVSIRWRRQFMPENFAVAYTEDQGDGTLTVTIDLRLGRQSVVDAILHELVHVYRHEEGADDWHEHGDAFWLVMGGLYRAWHRET